MADKSKEKEKERPAHSPLIPIPDKVWRITGLICIVVGYFYMYPVDTSGWFKWSKSGSGVETPLPAESPAPAESFRPSAENPRPEAAPTYSEEAGNIFFKSGCDIVELDIHLDRWSKMVVTPVDASEYRFSGGPGPYVVRFADGYEKTINDGSVEPFGVRRGMFRFRATKAGQKVKVAIKR